MLPLTLQFVIAMIASVAVFVPDRWDVAGVHGESYRSTRLADTGGRPAVQEMHFALVLDPDSPELRAERLRHSGGSLFRPGNPAPKPRKHTVRPAKSILDQTPESRQPPFETATTTGTASSTQIPVEVVAPLPQAAPSPGSVMDSANGGAASVEPAAGPAKASRSDSSVNPMTTYAATLVVVLAGLAGAYLIGRRRGARRRERIANAVSTDRASVAPAEERVPRNHASGAAPKATHMSIRDWFRPKWKHSDPAVRLAAVERLADQSALADIAKNDKDSEVRKAALARVTDQYDLADVAKNSLDSDVRKEAVERLADQLALADIAKGDNDCEVRMVALARVTLQSLLADVAKNSLDCDVRKEAVERLADQPALADIAKNDKDSEVRKAALARVTLQSLLVDIAKNSLDSEVRKEARARVTDESMLAEIAKNGLDSDVREEARASSNTHDGKTSPAHRETPPLAQLCSFFQIVLLGLSALLFYSQIFYEDGRAMKSATTWNEVGLRLLIIAVPAVLSYLPYKLGELIKASARKERG